MASAVALVYNGALPQKATFIFETLNFCLRRSIGLSSGAGLQGGAAPENKKCCLWKSIDFALTPRGKRAPGLRLWAGLPGGWSPKELAGDSKVRF